MAIFAYKGVHADGKSAKGSVTADSARAARAKMRSQGVILTELVEATEGARGAAREESDAEESRL
ncbi:MAG: hypothetical protein KC560_12670, partial [Myxococcales bacterium]|nr:hypothetical protein [Myxococcales bacterium]